MREIKTILRIGGLLATGAVAPAAFGQTFAMAAVTTGWQGSNGINAPAHFFNPATMPALGMSNGLASGRLGGRALTIAVPGPAYEERGVAAVLMGEAWSEGPRGMTAVAEVIHQRTVEKHQAPLQVISSHLGRTHAFSCLNGTTLDRLIQKFSQEPDYQKALKIAKTACETPARLPGLSNSANHYTRVNERPWWAKGKRPVAVVGQHAFYKLKYE